MAGHKVTGNQSNVPSENESKVKTDRQELNLSLREMEQGSWVASICRDFTKATSGKQQDSLDALRKASETSWFKDKDAMWVKLVMSGKSLQGPVVEPVGRLVAQSTISVSR